MGRKEKAFYFYGVFCAFVILLILVYQFVTEDTLLQHSGFQYIDRNIIQSLGYLIALPMIILYFVFMLKTMLAIRRTHEYQGFVPHGQQLFYAIVLIFTLPIGVWILYPKLKHKQLAAQKMKFDRIRKEFGIEPE